jgi:hypothetical protein
MVLVLLLSKEFHLVSWLGLPIIQSQYKIKETILCLSGFRRKSREKEEQKRSNVTRRSLSRSALLDVRSIVEYRQYSQAPAARWLTNWRSVAERWSSGLALGCSLKCGIGSDFEEADEGVELLV